MFPGEGKCGNSNQGPPIRRGNRFLLYQASLPRYLGIPPPGLVGSTFVSAEAGRRRANVPNVRSYDREVRSGNSRRKARNKGGTTTRRRPFLALLLGPLLMNFRARVSHHHSPCRCRAAVRTCRAAMELMTYRAIRKVCTPPTVVISAPGFLVGSGMGTRTRNAKYGPYLQIQKYLGPYFAVFTVKKTKYTPPNVFDGPDTHPGLPSCRTSGRRRALERSC